MKKKRFFSLFTSIFLSLTLYSCRNNNRGRIYFELNGGSFSDSTFNVEYLEGESNTPVRMTIPNPVKEGYTFISWREKLESGNFVDVKKIVNPDDNIAYYYYPYGNSTLYAYFEPLATISFDLTDGKNNDGKLIEPTINTYFSNDKLNGYTNMQISVTDYFPTASATHMSFEYWYLKKPLKKETTDQQTHYVIDESKEEGVYPFDEQFGLDSSVFPYSSTGDITLYAMWTLHPTITMHFNMDDAENYSFQAKNENIYSYLSDGVKEKLNLNLDNTIYYKNYRFAGFFLDSELTKQFFVNNPIHDLSLDIYLKWESEVTVTLDYNGGEVNGKDKESFTYFQNDVLPDSFFSEHTPTKANSNFFYFALDEYEYFKSSSLTTSITLVAVYEDDNVLTLSYTYPTSYAGVKTSDKVYYVNSSKDISSYLDSFKKAFSDDTNNDLLSYLDYYYISDSGENVSFTSKSISKDMNICLKVVYKAKLNIFTYSSSNTPLASSQTIEPIYIAKSGNIDLASYPVISSKETIGDKIYLPTSYYLNDPTLDDSLTTSTEITFPFSVELTDTEQIINIYRKMEEGVKLSFYDSSNNKYIVENNDNILYVVKDSKIDESSLPSSLKGKTLTIRGGQSLSNYFPSSSCDIIVS